MGIDGTVLSYIVIGGAVFGLTAGVVMFDMLSATQTNSLGTGDVYLIRRDGSYSIVSKSLGINGFLNTNMSLPMTDGVCYKMQYNIQTKPLTVSFGLTPVDLSNCD